MSESELLEKSNLLVLDVGINHGTFSSFILDHVKGSRVIGVDAHLTFCELTRERLGIKVLNLLVRERADWSRFCLAKIEGDSFYQPRSVEVLNTYPNFTSQDYFDIMERVENITYIQSTTLDKLIAEYGIPDIIKLTIEGAERLALQGLSQKVSLIIVEWYMDKFGPTNLKLCVERLKELGYTQYAYTADQTKLATDLTYRDLASFELPTEQKGLLYAK